LSRHVALLRGVNVGGNKRVPMAAWRELLAGLGYGNARTLLNSGNAVFDSPARSTTAHAARIRTALQEALGFDVPVIVKSARGMEAIAAGNTLAAEATDPSRLLVAFTADAASLAALEPVTQLARGTERVLLGEHALYLWCPDGILQSKAGEALLGKAGKTATTRNWATVTRLLAMLHARDD